MSSYPTVVSVEHVSKQFTVNHDKSLKERILHPRQTHKEDFLALDDVSLEIPMNTSLGLMGHNGSGKSTLLKIIGSIIQPTRGHVRHRGRIAALLELGAGFHQDLTGRENIFLNAAIMGMGREETEAKLDDIIEFSGIAPFIDTQVKFYSSGMYVRLAFAVAIHADPDILLVDEVLAVGDEPFQRKCMDKIREFQAEGRTIILVSHSAEQVSSVCDRAVVLDHGKLIYDGETREAVHALRRSFQSQRDEEVASSGGIVGADQVSLLDAKLRDTSGNSVTTIATDDALTLEFTVSSPRLVEQWIAAMSIDTAMGQALFYVDSIITRTVLPQLDGIQTLRFVFPRITLGDGSYNINFAIQGPGGTTLLAKNPALVLSVEGPLVGTGPVALTPEITMSPA